jgi:chemotaxis signal transduction protein
MNTKADADKVVEFYISGLMADCDDEVSDHLLQTHNSAPDEQRFAETEVVEDFIGGYLTEPKPSVLTAYTPLPKLKYPELFLESKVSSNETTGELLNSPSFQEVSVSSQESSNELPRLEPDSSDKRELSEKEASESPAEEVMIPQVLLVTCQQNEFGLDLRQVTEILPLPEITEAPLMPVFLVGYATVHNHVIPIIDLGYQLLNVPTDIGRWTSIVTVRINVDGVEINSGLLVDSVHHILDLHEPVTPMSRKSLLLGIAKDKEQMWSVLNLDFVFDGSTTNASQMVSTGQLM